MQITKTILTFFVTFSLSFNNVFAQINKDNTNIGVMSEGDTLTVKKEQLEDIVDYKAQNISNDFPKKTTYLLKEAEVKYENIAITADFITINWDNNTVKAFSKIDSTGKIIEKASFTQGQEKYQYESFTYNFETQQGIVYNGRTEENGLVMDAQISKRVSDSVYFVRRAIATGDEYYRAEKDSVADYHIAMNRAKFITDNALIAGASQLYIEQVPTPLVLPFLYVPLRGERSAGIILPSFGETDQLGFYLQGFGFYTPIGEYFDFEVTSDIYSKGSKALHARSTYKKNYRYSGNFSFNIEERIQGIKGLTSGVNAYQQNNNFRINWSHIQDRKANPNLIFRSNVGYSSSKYYRQSVDNTNVYNQNFLNNTSNSSISVDKYFNDFPMNISLSATLNQNFNTEDANMTLPQLNANLSRQYPLKNSSDIGLLKKIYFDYRMNLQNQMKGKNEDLFKSETFKKAQNGVKNAFSFGTQTTLFNYFPLTFSGSYDEVWSLKSLKRYYDSDQDKVVNEDINGFSSYRTYNFSSGVSTALYGTLLFDKTKMIQGIRHTIQPSVGYSMRPDFSEDRFDYYDYYTDAEGNEVQYSKFENGVFGSPGKGLQQNINFSIGNNLEMKVRNKTDSLGVRKIKIFDYLNMSSSYNMAADSLKMSNINVRGSTSFFNNKFKVNFATAVNPYRIEYDNPEDITGTLIDELGYFSVLNYNVGVNFTLNNALFGEETNYAEKYGTTGRVRYENYYFDAENYAHFNVPWSANVNFKYANNKGINREGNEAISVGLSGKIAPSPYWSISYNTSYDFVNKKLAFTRFTFSRDLRSFVINFNWVPFGAYRSWNFGIYIKTPVLRDALKYDDQDYRRGSRPF